MNRAEKIKKLANAIRAWRGLARNGKFIHAPQPAAAIRAVKWLESLGHSAPVIQTEINLIASFKTVDEFEAWMRKLQAPAPLSTAAVMGGAA